MTVISDQHGREPDSKNSSDGESLVGEATLDTLEADLRNRFRAAAQDGSLLEQPGLMELLSRWARLGSEDEVRAWTGTLLSNDAHVLHLAKTATQIGRAHTSGDRVVREVPQVHRAGLEKVVDVNRLVERLAAIAAGGDEEAAGIAARFHAGPKRPF